MLVQLPLDESLDDEGDDQCWHRHEFRLSDSVSPLVPRHFLLLSR